MITAVKKKKHNNKKPKKQTPSAPTVFKSVFIGPVGKVTLGTDAS